ncbi:MAG: 4-alpha-glucanotransferase [Gammaproteobacteria bacterium]
MNPVLAARRAGVLLHPTSLPGGDSQGTLGRDAWRFVDWLAAGGFSVWQTLPLGPPDDYGSPYGLRSAHAGNRKLLDREHLSTLRQLPRGLDLDALDGRHDTLYRSFAALATHRQRRDLARYVRTQRWLRSYGLFELCSEQFKATPWWHWPGEFRDRDMHALRRLAREHRDRFRGLVLEQYLFNLQWSALKSYANDRGVRLFGDLPFYMDRNSVEVWWQRELFALDGDGEPKEVAGVPPDYFNADGQLWGNPLYDWDVMQRTGFRWWLDRLRAQLARFDLVRIDHFRALESYWAVPAGATTARSGAWRHGRGAELLTVLRSAYGDLPLVAEDLGIITDEVRALRDRFELPGMVVLQFGFDGSADNPHLPQQHKRNAVAYTGTHDNDTTVGWYAGLDGNARGVVSRMLGVPEHPVVPDFLIDAAYGSKATLAVVPMQDLLALDSSARMNSPGTVVDNWRWRFSWSEVPTSLAATCRARAARFDRLPRP